MGVEATATVDTVGDSKHCTNNGNNCIKVNNEAVDSEKGIIADHESLDIQNKRRKLRKCCTWCGIPALVVAIVIIALSQTIFKFRDPDITLSEVRFSGVKVDYSKPLSPASVNASLSANMNVYNPNHYNFKFTNSTIHVVYHDVMVGNISMPAGELQPGKSVALPALVTVGSLNLGRSMSNLYQDFGKNQLPFAMRVDIPGRVNVVHFFKHDVVLEYHCDVTFWVGNSSMKDYLCWKKVHM